jgi:hypothetical protein
MNRDIDNFLSKSRAEELIGYVFYGGGAKLNVSARGSGVCLDTWPIPTCFPMHPDAARELSELLLRAADLADTAVPGPIRNGKFDTKTSTATEGRPTREGSLN